MVLNVGIVITWMLFLALFPMAFIWLRRAWKIFIRHDYTEVALKGGEPPANPQRWYPLTGMLNLACGGIALWIILGVALWVAVGVRIGPFHKFDTWTAMAGITIWCKIFGDYIISRTAHPFTLGRKRKKSEGK